MKKNELKYLLPIDINYTIKLNFMLNNSQLNWLCKTVKDEIFYLHLNNITSKKIFNYKIELPSADTPYANLQFTITYLISVNKDITASNFNFKRFINFLKLKLNKIIMKKLNNFLLDEESFSLELEPNISYFYFSLNKDVYLNKDEYIEYVENN